MTKHYLTPADLLAVGFRLPSLPKLPGVVPAGTRCAITGQPIEVGYPVSDMVTDATAEFLDAFRGGDGITGWVSEAAARCFKSANPRTGNPCAKALLVFESEPAWHPMIARESARTGGRPCWSELVREIWPARRGQHVLAILTTDTKKRLWPRARVGSLGHATPVLYHDSATDESRVLLIDWAFLVWMLDLVEESYSAGYPKSAIRESLYMAGKVARESLARTGEWERRLVPWRGQPEFTVALLIAQKREEEEIP